MTLLNEDITSLVIGHLDLISLVYLFMVSKSLFSQRKELIKFSKYYTKNTDLLIIMQRMLLSYVNTASYHRMNYEFPVIYDCSKDAVCLKKVQNSLHIVSFMISTNTSYIASNLYRSSIRSLMELYSRSVCEEFGYTFKKSIINSLGYIFKSHLWLDCHIDVIIFFKLAYHLKFRKNRAILETLQQCKFTFHHKTYSNIMNYYSCIAHGKLRGLVGCIMVMYVNEWTKTQSNHPRYDLFIHQFNIFKSDTQFCVLRSNFPQYLKQYILSNIS